MEELGTIRRFDPRKVWKHEARDFTPWLEDNISRLSEVLGLDLDLVQSEVAAGSFAIDLLAKDVASGRWVVIENQLEPTDHTHLGQLLTYGAAKAANIFVWISPDFREEHQLALAWLNEQTPEGVSFFGIRLELIQIDESRRAPDFRLVAAPNEWQKSSRVGKQLTAREAAYVEFFTTFLQSLRSKYPGITNASKGQPLNWIWIAAGRTGFTFSVSFAGGDRFRVELYIDTTDKDFNERAFDSLMAQKAEFEESIGQALEWDRLDTARGCRISLYYQESVTVLDEPDALAKITDWAVEQVKTFRDVFTPRIKTLD